LKKEVASNSKCEIKTAGFIEDMCAKSFISFGQFSKILSNGIDYFFFE